MLNARRISYCFFLVWHRILEEMWRMHKASSPVMYYMCKGGMPYFFFLFALEKRFQFGTRQDILCFSWHVIVTFKLLFFLRFLSVLDIRVPVVATVYTYTNSLLAKRLGTSPNIGFKRKWWPSAQNENDAILPHGWKLTFVLQFPVCQLSCFSFFFCFPSSPQFSLVHSHYFCDFRCNM